MTSKANHTPGIQELMEAEREAHVIIEKARKGKQEMIKQARDEAKNVIGECRGELEQRFVEYRNQYSGDAREYKERLEELTNKNLDQIASDKEEKRQEVVNLLLKGVVDVNLENLSYAE